MLKFLKSSFRKKLTVSFLLVSLIPLLVCSFTLLEVFKIRLSENSKREAEEQLAGINSSLSQVCGEFKSAAETIDEGRALIREITRENKKDTLVYKELFSLTNKMRGYARFDIYGEGGVRLYSTGNYLPSEKMPIDRGIFYFSDKSEDGIAFHTEDNCSESGEPLIEAAYSMKDRDGKTIGYLLMTLDDAGLQKIFEGKHYQQNELIILNKYWRPVYSSLRNTSEEEFQNMRRLVMNGKSLDSLNESFAYTMAYNDDMSLYILLKRPREFALSTLSLLYTVTFFTACACVVISIFLSIRLSRHSSKPIEELHKAIDEVGNNNLDVMVKTDYDDELGQLAEKFNIMVRALKINQEQMVENQKELNEAQIRMLQAQLNPHFLCNTLDTMKWISKINKVPQVALMSTNLADILRFCISPQEFVPFEKEIEVLESYIEIQKIRLSDNFSLKLEVPFELYSCMVPKMILQPIVENAIMHGLEGVENGEITVKAHVDEENILKITVEDNGSGFPPEMVGRYSLTDKTKLKGHLGLYNVDTILIKYYGGSFGLYLENKDGQGGAKITASLPVQNEEEV